MVEDRLYMLEYHLPGQKGFRYMYPLYASSGAEARVKADKKLQQEGGIEEALKPCETGFTLGMSRYFPGKVEKKKDLQAGA